MNIRFTKNDSSYLDIKSHLERCDKHFVPFLSSYININQYARKLFKKSIRYEIYIDSDLIGLAAVYINLDIAFISNFSIENEHFGKGLSRELILECILDLTGKVKLVELDVFEENIRALNFYEKLGFVVIRRRKNVVTLVRKIR